MMKARQATNPPPSTKGQETPSIKSQSLSLQTFQTPPKSPSPLSSKQNPQKPSSLNPPTMEVKTKPNTTHNSSSSRNLPPGFRFHPTDEELIVHYLKNQVMSKPCPVSIIPEVDIYKFDPWQLPEKAEFGEKEWYFFTPRERKYPNGVRPNRAAVSGYWKATGTDKSIHSGSRFVGIKKALVFYMGRPPKGTKTDWIMHEYRLNQPSSSSRPHLHVSRPAGSMKLDDWVLCRIYRKKHGARRASNEDEEGSETRPSVVMNSPTIKNEPSGSEGSEDHHLMLQEQQQMLKFPRTFSLTHLLELDYLGPITHLLNDPDGSYNGNAYEFQSNISMANSGFDMNGSLQGLFGDLSRTSMNPIGAGLNQQWQANSSFGYKFP